MNHTYRKKEDNQDYKPKKLYILTISQNYSYVT